MSANRSPARVRPIEPDDDDAVLSVVVAAFSDATRDGSEEVDIVRRTWACSPIGTRVEFVAEDSGAIVGHALAACGRIDDIDEPVGGLAPVGVAPEHQADGIGSALVRAVVVEATARGWDQLVVLGAPSYYGRFGFEAAARVGLIYEPVGPGDPHFQARTLRRDAPRHRGVFSYCWE